MAEDGHKVTLNVYDLSQGLARQLSTTFLGKAIEGIWHTGVVVYGSEYYFGGGIQNSPAGTTQYGTPLRVLDLGVTHVPKDVFEMYLQEISPRYTAETYSLLTHNCNNFSNEVTQFLVGTSIPNYILQLPNEVMSSPMGALMLPMIQNLETTMRSGAVPQVPQFRPTTPMTQAAITRLPTSAAAIQPSAEVNTTKSSNEDAKSKGPSSKAPEESKNGCTSTSNGVTDLLGDARSKVQEEITAEFAAIMATGTFRASEAAALATKRVMQKHGRLSSTMSQS